MAEDPEYLHDKAAQCFRLAKLARDAQLRDELERLGRELEVEAVKAEARRAGKTPPRS